MTLSPDSARSGSRHWWCVRDPQFCTPLPLSEELATKIPGATLVVFEGGGELIELEQDEKYFKVVGGFLREQTTQNRS